MRENRASVMIPCPPPYGKPRCDKAQGRESCDNYETQRISVGSRVPRDRKHAIKALCAR